MVVRGKGGGDGWALRPVLRCACIFIIDIFLHSPLARDRNEGCVWSPALSPTPSCDAPGNDFIDGEQGLGEEDLLL